MTRLAENDIVQRGEALYEQRIRPLLDEARDRGKLVVINVETGQYEIDADDVAAARRARARFGEAALFTVRVGHETAYRFGGRFLSAATARDQELSP